MISSFFFDKRLLLLTTFLCGFGTVFCMVTDETKTSVANETKTSVAKSDVFNPSNLKNGESALFTKISAVINKLKEEGNEYLNAAADYGSFGLVVFLVNQGVDASRIDDCSALCNAVKKGHGKICRFLLKQKGVDAKYFCECNGDCDDTKQHTIFDVVRYCDLKTVQAFVQHRVDPLIRDKDRNTLLHTAARFDKADVAEWLIKKHQLPVDSENDEGESALYVASEHGASNVARVLLAQGAKVEKKNGEECSTALHVAAHVGASGMVKLLITAGADINAKNKSGDKPFFEALKFATFDDLNTENTKVFDYLWATDLTGLEDCLEHGANPKVVAGLIKKLCKKVHGSEL